MGRSISLLRCLRQIPGHGKPAARAFADGGIADRHFNAPGRASNRGWAVVIHSHVPKVPRPSQMAAQQPAVANNRPTHTRAQSEQDHVPPAARRTLPHFAQ